MATKKSTPTTDDPGIELDDLWREKKARGDKPRRVVRILYLTNDLRDFKVEDVSSGRRFEVTAEGLKERWQLEQRVKPPKAKTPRFTSFDTAMERIRPELEARAAAAEAARVARREARRKKEQARATKATNRRKAWRATSANVQAQAEQPLSFTEAVAVAQRAWEATKAEQTEAPKTLGETFAAFQKKLEGKQPKAPKLSISEAIASTMHEENPQLSEGVCFWCRMHAPAEGPCPCRYLVGARGNLTIAKAIRQAAQHGYKLSLVLHRDPRKPKRNLALALGLDP